MTMCSVKFEMRLIVKWKIFKYYQARRWNLTCGKQTRDIRDCTQEQDFFEGTTIEYCTKEIFVGRCDGQTEKDPLKLGSGQGEVA